MRTNADKSRASNIRDKKMKLSRRNTQYFQQANVFESYNQRTPKLIFFSWNL